MKKFKKLLSFILVVTTFIISISFMNLKKVSAISLSEVKSKAIALSNDASKKDKLKTEDAENWYTFKVTEKGYFELYFEPTDNADVDKIGYGWNISLYKDQLSTCYMEYKQVESAIKTDVITLGIGTYYVKVESNWHSSSNAPVDQEYSIKYKFVKTNYCEQENNDTLKQANSIEFNKGYKGNLYKVRDEDYFSFNITERGYFTVKFGPDADADFDKIKDGWEVTITDANNNIIYKYHDVKDTILTNKIPSAKGKYYVNIKSEWSSPVNCLYNLRVNFVATNAYEIEGNDTSAKATKIGLNSKLNGCLYDKNDVDWYKVKVSSNGTLNIKFAKSKYSESTNGWYFYVYDSDFEKVHTANGIAKDSVTLKVKKGNYYIKVVGSYSAPVDQWYNLTTAFAKTPSKVSISSITAGTKKATLKWAKSTSADGYYIYRSTSKTGKYKLVKTVKRGSTISYADSKLTSGKKYYYYIVAYNKNNGVKAKSKKSSIVYTTAK